MSHTSVRDLTSKGGLAVARRRLVIAPVTIALLVTTVATASARTTPATLSWTVDTVERPSLSPGGSVYDSQVPAAARVVGSSRHGSLYDSQVPAAARR